MNLAPELLAHGPTKELLNRWTVCFHRLKQRAVSFCVRLGQRRQRIESEEQFVGLLSVKVEYKYWKLRVRSCVLAQVAVDQHQLPIGQLSGEQRIRVADLRQKSTQRVGLSLRMSPPVFGIWQQVPREGRDATREFDL